VNFDTFNPELEKCLQGLKALVLAEGAFLHPRLTVRERAGSFDLRSGLEASVHDRLIKMPVTCLPPVEAFDLYVCGNDICIRSTAPGTSFVHVRCMEAMLGLYNISGKLADTRQQSPLFVLAPYPEILGILLGVKDGAVKFEQKRRQLENGRLDELLLASFIGTRFFKLPEQSGHVLMPFIDYINHHFLASGFKFLDKEDAPALCVENAKPVSGSDEVFVSYFPMMDPVDSWLNYNFVDEASPIAKSVPLVIDIGSGRQLRVKAFSGSKKLAPPRQLQDLKALLPSVIEKSEHHLTVSHLIIPHDKAPLSLRRILRSLIQTLHPGLEKSALRRRVDNAEAQVIDANTRFYQNLGDAVERVPKERQEDAALSVVQKIVQLQTAKIAAYQLRIEKLMDRR
jgi:hypothetical protein